MTGTNTSKLKAISFNMCLLTMSTSSTGQTRNMPCIAVLVCLLARCDGRVLPASELSAVFHQWILPTLAQCPVTQLVDASQPPNTCFSKRKRPQGC